MTRRYWTIREHNELVALIEEDPELSISRIAGLLKRTPSSVAGRIKRLGLRTAGQSGAPYGNTNHKVDDPDRAIRRRLHATDRQRRYRQNIRAGRLSE
jgi:DNA-binding MarR family transcriptional regulator